MEWFENEDFWLNYGPIMFDEQHWAEAPGVADALFELCNLNEGDSVLDVCCGPGRISVEMALNGANVTGVDITKPYLDAATESAKDENVDGNCNFVLCDMRKFNGDKKFKAAYNVYNSFGYCDNIEDDTKILESVYKNLENGGTFVLECICRESAIKYFTEGEWFERAGMTVLTEFSVVGAWEGLKSKWILIGNKNDKPVRIEHEFVQRLYSAAELRDKLLKIGFKSVEVSGGWDKRPFDQNLSTMVLVAKK